MITIESLIEYRKQSESHVKLNAKVNMPTDYGKFDMYGFTTDLSDEEIVVIVKDQFVQMKMFVYTLHV